MMCSLHLSLVHLLKHGRLESARQLLLDCCYRDLEEQEDGDGTALHWACSRGYADIVDLLLTFGSKLNSRTKCALTPLHCASGNGYIGIVRTLLHWGADVRARSDCGDTPCHIAAYKGQAEIISLLLKHGANPLMLNNQGRDAMAEALANHQTSVVTVLQRVLGYGMVNGPPGWPSDGSATVPRVKVTVTSDPESEQRYRLWQEQGRHLSWGS